MCENPVVTVAMSMHNASRFLRECIDSVLAQTFADFELLIADDGSTDSSLAIALSYADSRIRVIRCHHDFIASLNTLLREARGSYIARMDADDIMLPTRLEEQVRYLDAHGDVAAVCGQAVIIDTDGRVISKQTPSAPREVTLRDMAEVNVVANPTTMMRRVAVESAGLLYEQAFCWAEDYRFWVKFLQRCGRIVNLGRPMIKYRQSPGQVTAVRWDDMMEASARIRSELTATLVDRANPGYTDPDVPAPSGSLTLIIPFLNEGEEVAATVRSFLSHASGPVDVIVINDASYDSYPYMEELAGMDGVTYVLNRERLGVAASRDKGVALCRTPYFLLLDAHMRAYDDSWLTVIPRLLTQNDRRILCCKTLPLKKNSSGQVSVGLEGSDSFGARLNFSRDELIPGIKWINEEADPGSDIEVVPAVLGAGYALSRNYWHRLGGLMGLRDYGCDEQFLSLKAWLEGGECLLLKKVVLGHIYRKESPYSLPSDCIIFNSLVISETLFPAKWKCLARAAAYVAGKSKFQSIFSEVRDSINADEIITKQINSLSGRQFSEFLDINRRVTSVESELRDRILQQIPVIYDKIQSSDVEAPGIGEGLTGQAVWLFHYSGMSGSEQSYELALNKINQALNRLPRNDFSFQTGVAGIGWAILYLDSVGLVPANEDSIYEIDSIIADRLVSGYSDVSFLNGEAGILAYITLRCKSESGRLVFDSLLPRIDTLCRDMLSRTNDPVAAFYGMLWLQQRADRFKTEFRPSPCDWSYPSNYISADSSLWAMSMVDGVLSTSLKVMLNE